MFLTHSKALWRIEFRTDLTRAGSAILPIGFVMEARWSDGVCWMGTLFRKRLTPLELDQVDVETWPEMKALEPLMNDVFDKAWNLEDLGMRGDGLPALASDMVAGDYPIHGSLQFKQDDFSLSLSKKDPEASFPTLYARLLALHGKLTPILSAPVVTMPRKIFAPAIKVPRADVEHFTRAA